MRSGPPGACRVGSGPSWRHAPSMASHAVRPSGDKARPSSVRLGRDPRPSPGCGWKPGGSGNSRTAAPSARLSRSDGPNPRAKSPSLVQSRVRPPGSQRTASGSTISPAAGPPRRASSAEGKGAPPGWRSVKAPVSRGVSSASAR